MGGPIWLTHHRIPPDQNYISALLLYKTRYITVHITVYHQVYYNIQTRVQEFPKGGGWLKNVVLFLPFHIYVVGTSSRNK